MATQVNDRTASSLTRARDGSPEPEGPAVANGGAFLSACRNERTTQTPIWFMRQAGRSLPEYRAIRRELSMFEVIRTPDVAAEVTLQPVRRYGVDAAILFSDITTPLEAAGLKVELREGVGPVFPDPIRSEGDVDRIRIPDAGDLAHVTETVRLLVPELGAVPLIGFAGAPFTLASYLIEGGPSKQHARTKALMLSEPSTWFALVDRLADVSIAFVTAQVRAGATAVQLFDSWAGALAPAAYEWFVQPASSKVLAAVRTLGVPSIHFGVGTGELLELFGAAGADVVGIDWRVPLGRARRRLPNHAVQGNLDPAVCLAPWPFVAAEASAVLDANGGAPGHIFNLGHGVLPETDPGILAALVDWVHEHTAVGGEPE
jgi:uroporphyrinogen decarboxylase